MNNVIRKSALALAIVATFSLTACFDGGSNDAAAVVSTNKTTTGVITGFGSVYINGVEYETDTADIDIEGVANSTGDDTGLKLGMVVTLSGDANADGTGTALSITYDDELEGTVTEIPVAVDGVGTLQIMGLTINFDEDTVFESKVAGIDTIEALTEGNVIEVSGYSDGNGTVWATRLELKKNALEADDEVELKGKIRLLTATNFTIGAMVINFETASLSDDLTELADDMFVEVKSDGTMVDGELIATEIELKGERKKKFDFDEDDDEVEVEGVITAEAVDGVFDVNGATVKFDANTRFVHGSAETIVTGLKVKVKGKIDVVSGDFVAELILFKPTGDLKMAGYVSAPNAIDNTITLFGLTIMLKNDTFVDDDRDEDDDKARVKYNFGADDLVEGDWVKLKAYKNSNGELVASKMVRKSIKSTRFEKLEGKVEAIDATNAMLITLAGVAVDLTESELVAVVGEKMELKGRFDVTSGVFSASEGEMKDADDRYIGGEDTEENERDHKKNRKEDSDNDDESENESDDADDDADDDNKVTPDADDSANNNNTTS